MKLIFGLGNPGTNYDGTRHNAGFMTLSLLAAREGASFADKPKFKASVAELNIGGEKVLVVKPDTFYNLVGESYRAVLDFYKLDPADTLVIHDELALPFGTIRTRVGGTDAGNNGIKSINQHGGTDSNRIRIGIANHQRQTIGDTDFVLARFTAEETVALQDKVLPKVLEAIDAFLAGSHAVTSHKLVDSGSSPL